MNEYRELYEKELKYRKELEESIDSKYIEIIQLEVENLELKQRIDEIVKRLEG